jgi:hypothetical protein
MAQFPDATADSSLAEVVSELGGPLAVVDGTAETKLEAIRALLAEPLTATRAVDSTVTGALTTISGAGSEVVADVVPGYTMVVGWFHGTYTTATVSMEVTFNAGTTWMVLLGASIGTGSSTTTPLSGSSSLTIGWEAAIPAGVQKIRARCSVIASGTIEAQITQGTSDYETVVGFANGTLAASAAVIGGVFAPGQWTDLSSTVLAANGTFTGGSIDTTTVSTATSFTSASLGTGEVRGSATSDKPGTLFLETSRDNATFFKIKSAKIEAASGCEPYAEIIHKPSERYARFSVTNGAELQTKFKIQQFRLGII